MEIKEIVEKINRKEVQVKDIAKEMGINPSTLQRRMKKEGYVFDKKADKWIRNAVQNPEIQEVSKQENKEYRKKVIHPTNNKENKESNKPIVQEERKQIKKVTYEISEDLHFEFRMKAFREKRNVSELVEQAMREFLSNRA